MKKTLNSAILAAVAVIFAFSTVSCSKDDPSFDSALLLGSWYMAYDECVEKYPGEEPDVEIFNYTKTNSPTVFRFYQGGTGQIEDVDEGTDEFEWSLRGDKLSIQYEGEDETMTSTIKELTSTTLKLYYRESAGGESFEQTTIFNKM